MFSKIKATTNPEQKSQCFKVKLLTHSMERIHR